MNVCFIQIVESSRPKIMTDNKVMPVLSGDWKKNSLMVWLFSGLAACILLVVFLVAAWRCRTNFIRLEIPSVTHLFSMLLKGMTGNS